MLVLRVSVGLLPEFSTNCSPFSSLCSDWGPSWDTFISVTGCLCIDVGQCFCHVLYLNYCLSVSRQYSHCGTITVLLSQCCITVMPSLCYRHCVAVTMLSSLCCHLCVTISVVPSLCFCHNVVITVLLSQCCRHCGTIYVLQFLWYHHCVTVTMLSSLCYCHYVVITVLPSEFVHRVAKVAMVSFHQQYRFDFLTTQSADGILGDSHQMLPVSKSRVMTTAVASQAGAFSLGKGHFNLLISETCTPSTACVGWDGCDKKANDSSLCSWYEFVIGLCLCINQFSLVVS